MFVQNQSYNHCLIILISGLVSEMRYKPNCWSVQQLTVEGDVSNDEGLNITFYQDACSTQSTVCTIQQIMIFFL